MFTIVRVGFAAIAGWFGRRGAFIPISIPAVPIFSLVVLMVLSGAAMGGGDRIAFSLHYNGQWDLHSSLINGDGKKQLTNDSLREINPIWSPNGGLLAFSYGEPNDAVGGDGLFVIQSDGAGLRELTQDRVIAPRFSPDGKFISYFTGEGEENWFFCSYNKFKLHIVDLENDREVMSVNNLLHAIWLGGDPAMLWMNTDGGYGLAYPASGELHPHSGPTARNGPAFPLVSSLEGSRVFWISLTEDWPRFIMTDRKGQEARYLFALPFGHYRILMSDYWGCGEPRRLVLDWSLSGSHILLTKIEPITSETEYPISDPPSLDISLFNLSIVDLSGSEVATNDIPYTSLLFEPHQLEQMRAEARANEGLHGHIRESTIGVADAYWMPDGRGIVYAVEGDGKWRIQTFDFSTKEKRRLFPEFNMRQIAFLACCGQ